MSPLVAFADLKSQVVTCWRMLVCIHGILVPWPTAISRHPLIKTNHRWSDLLVAPSVKPNFRCARHLRGARHLLRDAERTE